MFEEKIFFNIVDGIAKSWNIVQITNNMLKNSHRLIGSYKVLNPNYEILTISSL